MIENDPFFRVEVVSASERPQTICYLAARQDYSEGFAFDEFAPNWRDPFSKVDAELSESEAGRRLVENCLKFLHYGVTEHPQLVVNAAGFPHEVMQQARTHRFLSFDVQSGRYTGKRICQVAEGLTPVETVYYIRPVGDYTDRKGNKYYYSEEEREKDISFMYSLSTQYKNKIDSGFSEEHARQLYSTYGLRQNFVASGSLRAWLHFIDVRFKADVQLETQTFAGMVWQILEQWVPEIAEHYKKTRLYKNKLAP